MWEKKPVIDKETNTQIGEYTRIWLAVDRNRLEVIAFHVGGGTRNDAKSIWKKLTHSCIPLIVCTDGNYSYASVIPKHKTHIISKSETCLVEAKNSSLRDNLARLNRRTKRYSKSKEMLELTLYIFYNRELALSTVFYQCPFKVLDLNYL
jgi:insertion element IS1 protein InsB